MAGKTRKKRLLGKVFRRVGRSVRIKPKRARVIGVFSCKGGVGKTTTVCNVSVALAKMFGGDVLAVDANFNAPNLNIHFGELEPRYTIHEVLAGEIPIEKAVHKCKNFKSLDVLFGTVAHGVEVHLVDFGAYLKPLRKKYKVILLDTAPGLGSEVVAAMKASDEMLIVTGPEAPTITSTLKTFYAAEDLRVPVLGAIVNRITGADFELPPREIKRALGWPIVAEVPEDIRVRESTAREIPIVEYMPKTKAARKFVELAKFVYKHIKKG
jgi:MinD-like ATPase involved in chromosome partitioning or flagellar assembly